ncbi:MAG: hypothetical protein SCH71_10375 [Desulfobulbaceae bacterium]|nr:hypothetical protein [Desulfobulbaceae bacterium]
MLTQGKNRSCREIGHIFVKFGLIGVFKEKYIPEDDNYVVLKRRKYLLRMQASWLIMFTEMIADLNHSIMPEPVNLAKRFDFAMTKKLGVVKLPSSFWSQDPKINPRADHLLWAALLLGDRERIDLALSVIAVEGVERNSPVCGCRHGQETNVRGIIDNFFRQIPDIAVRRNMRSELCRIIPEWLEDSGR